MQFMLTCEQLISLLQEWSIHPSILLVSWVGHAQEAMLLGLLLFSCEFISRPPLTSALRYKEMFRPR